MSQEKNKFYLTTPIYYVNARPHIGHAYTTIVADVLARRHRLLGDDTFFLTGTDEHGQKIARSAAAAGIPPQQFADQVSNEFRALWDRMGLLNDSFSKDDPLFHRRFIRTTDDCHKRGVQHLFNTLYARGFIYLSTYTGSYCVSDEAFVDAPAGTPCPDCGRLLETVTEENFFFKLSEFQKPIIDLIESNTLAITPESRRNEVLSFLRGGLKDLSISRSSFTWGVPVPEEAQRQSGAKQKHVIYVWLDALANYMTAIGYGTDTPEAQAEFARYWPADLHLVGKEIIRFHCVYWPAFLLALNPALQRDRSSSQNDPSSSGQNDRSSSGLQPAVNGVPEGGALAPASLSPEAHAVWAKKMLPKAITAHGWLLFDNAKMSKSKGNIVRTETILEAFGEHVYAKQFPESTKRERDLFAADVLRYFLLREIPFGQDGSFSFDAMVTRYNADLANGYGNLVSRTLTMIEKYFNAHIPNSAYGRVGTVEFINGIDRIEGTVQGAIEFQHKLNRALNSFDFSSVLELSQQFIKRVDQFLSDKKPWKLDEENPEERIQKERILYAAADAVKNITFLLYPFLPYSTSLVWKQLGLSIPIEETPLVPEAVNLRNLKWGGLKPGTKLGALAPIFPRAPKELADIMADIEEKNALTTPNSQLPTHEQTQLPPEPNPPAGAPALVPPTEETVKPSHITIDDFAKVELRVAQILVAERIPKADKLLRLEVDLGPEFPEKRQILSGIAEWYTPEELIGRRIVVITNLAPRKMRGLESHGMLLAASESEGSKPVLATFSEEIALGSRLK